MKSILHSFLLLSVSLMIGSFVSCKEAEAKKDYQPAPEKDTISQKDLVKRGKYLVNTIGCQDCHSPKRMGERGPEYIKELSFSGYQAKNELPPISQDALDKGWMLISPDLTAAVGPWGVSFAANLTSDDTGIGNWSFEQFKRSLTEGKLKGLPNGRMLLPPMPWENFKNLEEEDLRAMYEYFLSTEPVNNPVPPPIPPQKLTSL
ncbi:diheme cytochrome c-553 [Salegentibacter sp.]|uniref:diheme cytochrome c-553 n=1 Tax=Salegentibacter sp. TaxID=1903072 RepID=UPI003561B637